MAMRDSLVAVLVALLWGAQVTAVKIGGEEIPPIFMVAMRFAIIAAVLVPFCKLPKREQASHIILIATLTGALHFGFLYSGIALVDASTSAIAYQLATPFTVLLAFVLLGENVTIRMVSGIALAFIGVVIVMGGVGPSGELLGAALVILAALIFALGTIATKKWGPFNPLAMNGWVAIIAAPELMVLSALLEHGQWEAVRSASSMAWQAVLYTAISGGLIGFGLWYWLLGRHPVARLTPFTLLVPVFAVAVSQILLDEKLTINLLVGGVVTIVGVALCQISAKRKSDAGSQTASLQRSRS